MRSDAVSHFVVNAVNSHSLFHRLILLFLVVFVCGRLCGDFLNFRRASKDCVRAVQMYHRGIPRAGCVNNGAVVVSDFSLNAVVFNAHVNAGCFLNLAGVPHRESTATVKNIVYCIISVNGHVDCYMDSVCNLVAVRPAVIIPNLCCCSHIASQASDLKLFLIFRCDESIRVLIGDGLKFHRFKAFWSKNFFRKAKFAEYGSVRILVGEHTDTCDNSTACKESFCSSCELGSHPRASIERVKSFYCFGVFFCGKGET